MYKAISNFMFNLFPFENNEHAKGLFVERPLSVGMQSRLSAREQTLHTFLYFYLLTAYIR